MGNINAQVIKERVEQVGFTKAEMSFSSPQQSYDFLVDTINMATTLKKLPYNIKGVPSGNIDALNFGRRNLRLHDKNFNGVPDGKDNKTERQIPFNVKKCDFDIWLDNDDMYYYAARQANSLPQQPDLANPANLQALVISAEQKVLAMDMQDLMFNGDTAYPTAGADADFFRVLDGFVKKLSASPHKKDLTTSEVQLTDLLDVVAMMPEEFKSNFNNDIVWIMNQVSHDKILRLLLNRNTNLGDAVITDGKITRIFGYNVEIVEGMMGTLKDPADASKGRNGMIFLTPMMNLVPVSTYNPSIKYRTVTAATDVIAAKKDASYHIWNVYLDAVVREVNGCVYLTGENV